MNRRELRADVYLRVGIDTSDTMVTPEVVAQALNDSLHFIELEHDWPWLEASETLTTTSGTATLTPASNWTRTRTITYSDGTALELVSISELDTYDPTSTGQPSMFAEWAGALRVWPTPDATYTLYHRYYRTEPDLASDDASPLMPTSMHPALTEHAAYLILSRIRDEERASICLKRYQEWIRVMTDNRRRVSRFPSVRIREGAWL